MEEEYKKKIEQNEQQQRETEAKLEDLGKLFAKNGILSYDPTCVRKRSNWNQGSNIYKFDNETFEPKTFLKDMSESSPKLDALMKNIEKLDREDMKNHKKLFKHFVFSDLKSGTYGAKMIASAFLAKGYTIGYVAPLVDNEKSKKRYHKIELLNDETLEQTYQNNFYMLSSVGVYDQPITVAMKKDMLKKFNQRPENIQGELVRFIILDSGFKEGIDLFDIKYIHIFEPSTVPADQKQVVGRGTRTCGQKGLKFHPHQGWPLDVFIYDLSIPEPLRGSFMGAKSAMDLYFKAMDLDIRLIQFSHDLERTTVVGAVDYELNKNVHSFSIPFVSVDDDEEHGRAVIDEHIGDDVEVLYGGTTDNAPKKRKLVIRDGSPIIVNNEEKKRLSHEEMAAYIRQNFGEFAWDPVKMENLCAEKQKGGAGELIKYSPTQDFIRHYFSPINPLKGMLLWNSVGTGKTCSAIAAATQNFEKNGYTILWITRTTLKSDIWKNMFDQVCNESIRHQIEHSRLQIPAEQEKRMRLLSKAWRIRPMSYKQFSNLVSKQNTLYDTLVKINGKEDPLRKTLLIIDEAHKLYGGDDLSSIERPDMNALHKALMYSYQYSGADSARLLLMTATPITKDPMELIQLLNLMRGPDEQMPADFSNFSAKYLNENGDFTEHGRSLYLDDIAGYVSYLNREKDARQFSQPRIHHVETPIIKDAKMAERFDKKIVQNMLDTNVSDLKKQIEEGNEKLEGELGGVNQKTFGFLKDEICGDLEGVPKTKCTQVVNSNIREMAAAAKQEVQEIRNKIKEIRGRIKERGEMKKTAFAEVKKNIEKYAGQYEKYKETLFYQLKDKCAKKVGNKNAVNSNIRDDPIIQKYDAAIQEYNQDIANLLEQLKNLTENYKKRMTHLKNMLKTDLNQQERSVINMIIRDERKEYGAMIRLKNRENAQSQKVLKVAIADTNKKRTRRYNEIRKTVKKVIGKERGQLKDLNKEKKALRKTLR
jgi:superfamily II DNA or RNA helicase